MADENVKPATGSPRTAGDTTPESPKRTSRYLTYLGPGNSVMDETSETVFPVGVEKPASQATIERLTQSDPTTRGENWNVREEKGS